MISKRLTATFAFKSTGDVPRVLYLGFDADEAKNALDSAKSKGYHEIWICRDIQTTRIGIHRAEPVHA